MIYRCILPQWAVDAYPNRRRVVEGEFSEVEVHSLNTKFYNIYYLPNHPAIYDSTKTVKGSQIDSFNCVFVDMDLKDGYYKTKEEFLDILNKYHTAPTSIVDSGGGIHAYWRITDLDAMSYLRLARRLMRELHTDEAVGQIYQLMRAPNTVNTKRKDDFFLCTVLHQSDVQYTCEQLDRALPTISVSDEEFCIQHYNKTYNPEANIAKIDETLPLKFCKLLRESVEVQEIWKGNTDDRSKSDYRLGHLLFANGFTREEALSTLVNCAKALNRAPVHRIGYAEAIVDKIWTYEMAANKEELNLSRTVREILERGVDTLQGERLRCYSYFDNTFHGFRLGHVIGLVGGSGIGKTSIALNMFLGFVKNNADYDHFFIPLEQPAGEIALRWKTICGGDTQLYDRVHIMSNYADDGTYRRLSLDEIKDYLIKFQEQSKRKIGCVVIDHIGALKKQGKNGENQDLIEICHQMKAFAVQTNTLLVMQSQAPREKAGIGDLVLDKDAAYGTVFFESYCDFMISLWQPLKRCHMEAGCPTATAFKFCKIRHKKSGQDKIAEDVNYYLIFDPQTERLRELRQNDEAAFSFFLNKATNKRKLDRKTDLITYTTISFKEEEGDERIANRDSDFSRNTRAEELPEK